MYQPLLPITQEILIWGRITVRDLLFKKAKVIQFIYENIL